jgi:hypothetical protein
MVPVRTDTYNFIKLLLPEEFSELWGIPGELDH